MKMIRVIGAGTPHLLADHCLRLMAHGVVFIDAPEEFRIPIIEPERNNRRKNQPFYRGLKKYRKP